MCIYPILPILPIFICSAYLPPPMPLRNQSPPLLPRLPDTRHLPCPPRSTPPGAAPAPRAAPRAGAVGGAGARGPPGVGGARGGRRRRGKGPASRRAGGGMSGARGTSGTGPDSPAGEGAWAVGFAEADGTLGEVLDGICKGDMVVGRISDAAKV